MDHQYRLFKIHLKKKRRVEHDEAGRRTGLGLGDQPLPLRRNDRVHQ